MTALESPMVSRVIKETAVVAALSVGFGLVANAVSENGLELGRDYFRSLREAGPPEGAPNAGAVGVAPPATAEPDEGEAPGTSDPGPAGSDAGDPGASEGPSEGGGRLDLFQGGSRETAARLLAKGFQVMTHDEARALFEDELFEYGAYVFIDARTPAKYEAGHIPQAVLFDHFHFERYIEDVVVATMGAQAVIVYCHGGECTDSELAAQLLLDRGVDPGALKVYVGGIEEWKAAGLPLEQGAGG